MSSVELEEEEPYLRLFEEEKSSPSKENGWELFRKTLDYEVWKKRDPSHKADLIKGIHTLRGIPKSAVRYLALNVECWQAWDRRLPSASVLETNEQGKVIHWRMKLPYCVNSRDEIHNVMHKDVEETDTTYVIFQAITDHSEMAVKDKTIRIETHFLGLIIRPHPVYPNSTSLTIVMQVDTKGWLPTFLSNRYIAKAPIQWLTLLSGYYWDEYSKNKDGRCKDMTPPVKPEIRKDEDEVEDDEDCDDYKSFSNDSLVVEARRIAPLFPAAHRTVVEQLCDEISELAQALENCQDTEDGDESTVTQCAEVIREKLEALEKEMQLALTEAVVDNFRDPRGTLNSLIQATLSLPDSPEREEHYSMACEAFTAHVGRMADTAKAIATCSVIDSCVASDPKWRKEICRDAKLMKKLARKTVDASKHVFSDHTDLEAKETFQAYKDNYVEQTDKVTAMVDIAVPRLMFFKKAEEVMVASLEKATDSNSAKTGLYEAFRLVQGSSKLLNRVLAVVKLESAVCKAEQQKMILKDHTEALTRANNSLVENAQEAITKSGDSSAQREFGMGAKKVKSAMVNLVEAVEVYDAACSCMESEPEASSVKSEGSLPAGYDPNDILELEVTCFSSSPSQGEASETIENAAISLEEKVQQWVPYGNAMVEAVARMAALMRRLANYARERSARKTKEWIDVAREIVEESKTVSEIAQSVVDACTDTSMKKALQQGISKINTISTQLNILTCVKAGERLAIQCVQVAIEMLRDNSHNLMLTVSEILQATESATIRVPMEDRSRLGLNWVKRAN